MFEDLYFKDCGEIGRGNRLKISIVCQFGILLKKHSYGKLYWYKNTEVKKEETVEERYIFLPKTTQWCINVWLGKEYHVYVTTQNKDIQPIFTKKINKRIMQEVKKAKKEYEKRKKEEKRLYFFDANKGRLKACGDNRNRGSYELRRYAYQVIDNQYELPKENCFLLGRVQKTIGVNKDYWLDFIEPIAKFELDFEGKQDFFGDEKKSLESELFRMLKFSIDEEEQTEELKIARIKNKMQYTVRDFRKEVEDALETGNVEKVRRLYRVLYEKQDCSEEKFQIELEKEEILCDANELFWIEYENKEGKSKEAKWIHENISQCTNKSSEYLEKFQKYRFY